MFPLDLPFDQNVFVVMKMVVSNQFSTLWVQPVTLSSPSVTDTSDASPFFNIAGFELQKKIPD